MTGSDRRILFALAPLLVVVPLAAAPAAPYLGVEIAEPMVKIVEGPDEDADLTVSVSVRVRNTTERELAVELTVQGVDRDGSEVFDTFLDEALKAGQERVLTDTDYMKEKVFKSVVSWRVEEARIRGGQPGNSAPR